jgi:nucleoside-diphosphate-sugar epimerase
VTVLILGASGFLGSWTLRALLAEGQEVVVLARPSSSLWRLDGLTHPVTVLRAATNDWPAAIRSCNPRVLLSLDWEGVAGPMRDDHGQWTNVDRLRAVATAAVESGAERLVGVGSQAEYGPQAGVISEAAEERPSTEYGRAKLAARRLLQQIAEEHEADWAWARVFSAYGPLDHDHWLLPTIARKLLAGEPVPLTQGVQQWSYLYGADAGAALAAVALGDRSGVFNVGAPQVRPLRATIEEFAQHFPTTADLRFGEIPYPPDPVMHLQPDVRRLSALGWAPRWSEGAGLAATAAWLAGGEIADPFDPDLALPRHPRA